MTTRTVCGATTSPVEQAYSMIYPGGWASRRLVSPARPAYRVVSGHGGLKVVRLTVMVTGQIESLTSPDTGGDLQRFHFRVSGVNSELMGVDHENETADQWGRQEAGWFRWRRVAGTACAGQPGLGRRRGPRRLRLRDRFMRPPGGCDAVRGPHPRGLLDRSDEPALGSLTRTPALRGTGAIAASVALLVAAHALPVARPQT